jgi:hypothetical protein
LCLSPAAGARRPCSTTGSRARLVGYGIGLRAVRARAAASGSRVLRAAERGDTRFHRPPSTGAASQSRTRIGRLRVLRGPLCGPIWRRILSTRTTLEKSLRDS